MTHNTSERLSIRVPDEQKRRAELLVEAGEYPNTSEVARDGLREVLARYDFQDGRPMRHEPEQKIPIEVGESPTQRAADSRARVASLVSSLWQRPADAPPVIIFDEAGATEGMREPPNTHIARSTDEFKKLTKRVR